MRSKYRNRIQALMILFFPALPLSVLVAQFKPDLRQQLYPAFVQNERLRPEFNWYEQQLTPADSNVTLLGRWAWGPCRAVAVQDHYAYLGNGQLFQVLDISNPTAPRVVGEMFTDGLPSDIAVKDRYAYVADTYGLTIIEVSNPGNLKIVTRLRLQNDWTMRIKVSQNHAYLTTFRGYLNAFDISDPYNPQWQGAAPASGELALAIDLYENFVYVGTVDGMGIDIFDVSGSRPRRAGFYPTGSTAFAISGKYLYASMGAPNFQVLDLSLPTEPKQIGEIELPIRADGVFVDHANAYLTASDTVLLVIDISTPEAPRLVGKVTKHGITAPGSETRSLSVLSGFAYVATFTGLWTIAVGDPSNPTEQNFFPTGGFAEKVDVVGDYAYVAAGYGGFWILNVLDPQNPQGVGHFSTGSFVADLAVVDQYAFVVDWPTDFGYPSHFWILDVSRPENPREIGRLAGIIHNSPHAIPTAIEVSESYVFITEGDSGLFIVDIADKTKPHLIGFFPTKGYPHDVAISGKYAYLANVQNNDQGGLLVIEVSLREHPREKGYASGFASGVWATQDTVYAAFDDGLSIFQITADGYPVRLGHVPTPGGRSGVDISVSAKFAYMAYGFDFVIVDVSIPTQPRVAGFVEIYTGAHGVAATGDKIFVAAVWGGLQIFRNDLVTSVAETENLNSTVKGFVLRQNYPNPFNAETAIEYELPEAGQVLLKVYNLTGNEVATLVNEKQPSGRYRIPFQASQLPSGIYVYQLQVNNQTLAKKMLTVK